MKPVEIFVWMLLILIGYDVVIYLLYRGASESASRSGLGRKWSSSEGQSGSGMGGASQWILGTGCLVCLFLLRLILRRAQIKPTEQVKLNQKGNDEDKQPKKRESFLTCRISDTTLNTYSEHNSYDFPGQLSPEQLQVLLEELKFRTDEKFDEIETWMEINDQDTKLWLQRLERVETEISYMRHQIFILMSNHAKVGATLGLGEAALQNREHVETLRDLSKILAQVKKQFNEDETKREIRDSGDHGDVHRGDAGDAKMKSVLKDDMFVRGENMLAIKDKEYCMEAADTSKDVKAKLEQSREKPDSSKIQPIEEKEKRKCENMTSPGRGVIGESDFSLMSEDKSIEIVDSSNKVDEDDIADKWNIFGGSLDESSIITTKNESKLDITRDMDIKHTATISQYIYEKSGFPLITSKGILEERKIKTINTEGIFTTKGIIDDPSESPLKVMKPIGFNINVRQEEFIPHGDSKRAGRSPSPSRRTVRFAQEKRDISPSKSPTWVGISKEHTVKQIDGKGVSDIKLHSTLASCGDGIRTRRDSISCPVVEDKRHSRRSILEKQLTHLERRASPSPPRQRQNRRSHVRSKVADYIRGGK